MTLHATGSSLMDDVLGVLESPTLSASEAPYGSGWAIGARSASDAVATWMSGTLPEISAAVQYPLMAFNDYAQSSPLQTYSTAAFSSDVGYNGSSTSTVAVTATGIQTIDGLLYGRKWDGGFISYTDPTSSSDYQSGYNYDSNGNGISVQNESFSRFSAQQLLATHSALNQAIYTQPAGAGGFSVEGFTNLGIDYGTPGAGTGTIRVANSSDPGTSYAFYPNSGNYAGDVWIGTSARTPTAGNYAWHTTIHELGHALGLKHGQDSGGVSNVALPAAWDAMEYSVMTYRSYVGDPLSGGYSNETWGYAQTWMMLDIQALQYMYGADYTSNNTDTTYTWSPTTGQSFINGALAINPGGNRIFSTIWDGGGIDTYDLSNYTSAVQVDLRAGQSSLFSATQRANLGDGRLARGNVYNALMYNGNNASLIENATGGSGNDTLIGNELANVLNGGTGADTMSGLTGNDYYVVDNAGDVVVENSNEGLDSVLSFVFEYNLSSNVELLQLQGSAVVGRGNDLNNYLFGTTGINYLDGGTGADYMWGGAGDDYYYIDNIGDAVFENAGEGNDTVYTFTTEYNLPDNVEALQMLGGAAVGRGNSANNYIFGTSSTNYIDGGIGADYMYGGGGNDYYWVDNAGDAVFEGAGEGTDTVYSSIYEYNLAANVESVILTDGAAIGRGNSGNNYLFGTSGSNFLDGAGGADYMFGYGGDDSYWVDNYGDAVFEDAGGGYDTVYSSVAGYALPSNVERLVYIGAGSAYGNAADNQLSALDGNASLTGGQGSDTFTFMNSLGSSTITDFSYEDYIDIDSRIASSIAEFLTCATEIAPDQVCVNLSSGSLLINGVSLSTLTSNSSHIAIV